MRAQRAYEELIRRVREESLLSGVEALLEWDEETFMPPGGVENRSRQMALLAGLLHDRGADPRIDELLREVEASPLVADPDSPPAVNVRELRRAYDREVRLPRSLVEETARVTSIAQLAWIEARQERTFSVFEPHLAKIVDLVRQAANCLADSVDLYDAVLEDHEPGATATGIAALFDELRPDLAALLDAIRGSKRRPRVAILSRSVPVERQRAFCELAARTVGFDFERGRLDESAHPFSTGIGPGDCRITTRFSSQDFSNAFFAVLHEVGHGLYEQGLDPEHHGTPMAEPASVGLDESQARFWENRVGRSRGFWQHLHPRAKELFGSALRGVDVDAFHLAIHRVAPTLVRVDADEVTYNLHVLVRFEIERALISGDLAVRDLPDAWREAYLRHVGVEPRDDAEGCLQDGHWAEGMFGYFPTYTLGDVFAAQLFAAAERDLGPLDAQFAEGEFSPLVAWLRAKIHRRGSQRSAAELVERATGAPPTARFLVERLRHEYGRIYDV